MWRPVPTTTGVLIPIMEAVTTGAVFIIVEEAITGAAVITVAVAVTIVEGMAAATTTIESS